MLAALVIHVTVALCDNQHQGIVPVPALIGNGRDTRNNLYWGADYGVKSWMLRHEKWDRVNATGPQPFLTIEELTWRACLDQLEFFVKSPMLLMKAVVGSMKERRYGRVIQIGSEVFERGVQFYEARGTVRARERIRGIVIVAVDREEVPRQVPVLRPQGDAAAAGRHVRRLQRIQCPMHLVEQVGR